MKLNQRPVGVFSHKGTKRFIHAVLSLKRGSHSSYQKYK